MFSRERRKWYQETNFEEENEMWESEGTIYLAMILGICSAKENLCSYDDMRQFGNVDLCDLYA